MTLTELDVFQDIAKAIEATTDEAVLRMGAQAPEVDKDDKVLGALHSMETKKMIVASKRLHAQSRADQHNAEAAETDEERDRLLSKYRHKFVVSHILSELVKYQLCSEILDWGDIEDQVEVRKDWMIVLAQNNNPHLPPALKRLFGIE